MMRYLHPITLSFWCILTGYTTSILPALSYSQEAQEDSFLHALSTQQYTVDALEISSQLPILRNYETMRSLLQTQNDLLLPGTIYPAPPAVFAIETHNTNLLKVILDIACPRTINHPDCTQVPPFSAAIHQNTDALIEILFPSQIPSVVQHRVQDIAGIIGIIKNYLSNRAEPNVLSTLSNRSLFEIALQNNDQDSITQLTSYLRQSYSHSRGTQRENILEWLEQRSSLINRPEPSTLDHHIWKILGSSFVVLGILHHAINSTKIDVLAIPTVVLCLGGAACITVGCITSQLLQIDQRIYQQEQRAIALYRHLIRELPQEQYNNHYG